MTEASTGRIRRSVRFAKLEQQSAGRPEAMPRRQRITVADHLESPSFSRAQDWTDGMGISPSGRFRVAETGSRRQAVSREGIRRDLGRTVLMILGIFLAAVLLAELASLGAGSLRIQKLNTRLQAMEERNLALRETLDRSSGDISVCTEAVKLNLVSSNGVTPITLTAPTGARMVLVETEAAEESGSIRASANSQGD